MTISIYKGSELISQPVLAKTQWEKARGLMFSRPHDVLFHFPHEQRLKFHMVFVFYPIDIIFLDDDHIVVDFKEGFRPFTFYYSKACSSTVIETYHGFIEEYEITLGDHLSIHHEGEIPMKETHKPETRMLHTTSLGGPRPARAIPVHDETDDTKRTRTERQPAKKPVKRTVKKPVRKTAAKKPTSERTTKKPVKRTTKKPTTKKTTPKKTAPSTRKTQPSTRKKPGTTARKKPVSKRTTKKPVKRTTKKPTTKKGPVKRTTSRNTRATKRKSAKR